MAHSTVQYDIFHLSKQMKNGNLGQGLAASEELSDLSIFLASKPAENSRASSFENLIANQKTFPK